MTPVIPANLTGLRWARLLLEVQATQVDLLLLRLLLLVWPLLVEWLQVVRAILVGLLWARHPQVHHIWDHHLRAHHMVHHLWDNHIRVYNLWERHLQLRQLLTRKA